MDTTEQVVEAAQDKIDELVEQDVDSVDSEVRYLAYGARLRTVLRTGSRYIAYTSDIGEAFRPVVPPWIVTAAYGVSWLYLSGDVGYETYKAHHVGPTPIEAANFSEPTRLALSAVQRATFQSIASMSVAHVQRQFLMLITRRRMALPAFTIHTVVAQAKKAFVNAKNPRVKLWGPTVTGLAIVPALPYMFDHPVEHATDRVFGWIREKLIECNQAKVPADRKEL